MRFIIMLAIHALTMTVLMGVGVTAVLSAGMVDTRSILMAAGAGFVLAIPVTWLVVRALLAKAVSFAVQRAVLLCAEATGDQAAAERATTTIAALARQAFRDADRGAWPRPVRIVAPADAYALLASADDALVVWHHGNMTELLAHLPIGNAPDVPAVWPEERFDLIWVLTHDGQRYLFRVLAQNLLAGDLPTGPW